MGIGTAWPLYVRCHRKKFTFAISSPDEFLVVVTGSIARSAKYRYLSYSEVDCEVFRPTGSTCHVALMGVKFGLE